MSVSSGWMVRARVRASREAGAGRVARWRAGAVVGSRRRGRAVTIAAGVAPRARSRPGPVTRTVSPAGVGSHKNPLSGGAILKVKERNGI